MAVNLKRGFVGDDDSQPLTCDDPLTLSTSGWYYSYNVNDYYRNPDNAGDCITSNKTGIGKFTPMNWCLSSLDKPIPEYLNVTGASPYFMGFNEPNNLHN